MKSFKTAIRINLFAIVCILFYTIHAGAAIEGISGTNFNLTAKNGEISTPDGGNYLFWGFANGNGLVQYPGPTMIVNQGQTITVTLNNNITVTQGARPNVSIVFPGFNVTAVGGVDGILTKEAVPSGTVTYSFKAENPGTYTYYSGTDSGLQIEMGLVGTLIVRPAMGSGYAYNHADTAFDREFLFFLSEMDPRVHEMVETFGPDLVDTTDYLANYRPVVWFMNGRAAPDTMAENDVAWLPHQPYNCFPRMHPGEKLLMRVVGGGRDIHPLHHHGNHAKVIAREGRMLSSGPGAGPDYGYGVFTIQSQPGSTVDAIFTWTGKGIGWDIYGDAGSHTCTPGPDGLDPVSFEDCSDHGKPIPVTLPGQAEVAFGGFYSGSPFLGGVDALPPGEGGLNPNGGFSFMWHSHTEKEMVNYDIFPGGMLTMIIIEASTVTID